MDTCGYLCIGVVCVCVAVEGGVVWRMQRGGQIIKEHKLWVMMEMCINCGDGFIGVCIRQNSSNCTL